MVEIKYTDKILKFKIDNHSQHKNKILEECNKSKSYSISNDLDQKIKSTDFSKDQKENHYVYFLKNILFSYSKQILKAYDAEKMGLINIWFQNYIPGDFHGWHTHDRSNLSGIYYINLPYKNMATQFKVLNADVEEGDMIIFPSHLSHRSPIFKEGTKTIISFNLSIM